MHRQIAHDAMQTVCKAVRRWRLLVHQTTQAHMCVLVLVRAVHRAADGLSKLAVCAAAGTE